LEKGSFGHFSGTCANLFHVESRGMHGPDSIGRPAPARTVFKIT
jgi:hypothetical protein